MDPDPDQPPTRDGRARALPARVGAGRLLLADQPDWRALARDLCALTPHTVTAATELGGRGGLVGPGARQCGEVRAVKGCLAVPVRDPATGALVAGLALCGPAARVAEPNEELVRLLREHASCRCSPKLAELPRAPGYARRMIS